MSIQIWGSGGRTLVGISPWLTQCDFRSREAIQRVLTAAMRDARDGGLFGERTTVVFPELIGLFFLLIGEPEKVFGAMSLKAATVAWLGKLNAIFNLSGGFEQVVRAKGADQYCETFSQLAKEFKVTIVAGSTPMFDSSRKVVNASTIFGPEGERVAPPIAKRFLTRIERRLGFHPGDGAVAIDRLLVAICADGWYPQSFQGVEADAFAIPAHIAHPSAWTRPWRGYDGPQPEDVVAQALTEAQAWDRYGPISRAAQAGIHNGLLVFSRGVFWDETWAGESKAVLNDASYDIECTPGETQIFAIRF